MRFYTVIGPVAVANLWPPSTAYIKARDPYEVSNASYGSLEFFKKHLRVTVLPVGSLNRF